MGNGCTGYRVQERIALKANGEKRWLVFLEIRHDSQECADGNDCLLGVQTLDLELAVWCREELRVHQRENDGSETYVLVFESNDANQLDQWIRNRRISRYEDSLCLEDEFDDLLQLSCDCIRGVGQSVKVAPHEPAHCLEIM